MCLVVNEEKLRRGIADLVNQYNFIFDEICTGYDGGFNVVRCKEFIEDTKSLERLKKVLNTLGIEVIEFEDSICVKDVTIEK